MPGPSLHNLSCACFLIVRSELLMLYNRQNNKNGSKFESKNAQIKQHIPLLNARAFWRVTLPTKACYASCLHGVSNGQTWAWCFAILSSHPNIRCFQPYMLHLWLDFGLLYDMTRNDFPPKYLDIGHFYYRNTQISAIFCRIVVYMLCLRLDFPRQ